MHKSDARPAQERLSQADAIARHPWRLSAAVALAALALFAPVLTRSTFITDDDSVLRVSLVSHVRNVPAVFGRDFMIHTDGIYRPLPYAVLATVRTVVPADAVVFWRLWMLAFHVLGALLVWRIAREFTTRTLPALAALAVFLCHPLASILAGQINLFPLTLGIVLYLGCLLACVRFSRTRRPRLCVLSLVLFAMGLFTSRVILSLPVLILCLELYGERTHPLRVLARMLPFAILIVGPAVLWLTLRPHPIFYAYPQKAHQSVPWYWVYGFAAGGVDTVIGLVTGRTTPVAVSSFTGRIAHAWNVRTVFYGCVLLFVLVAALWRLHRRDWLFVGLFLMLAGVSPRFHSWANLSEDYVSWTLRVLPLAGFALTVGAVVDVLARVESASWRRVVAAGVIAGVAACMVFLVAANVRLRRPVRYWRQAVRDNPRSQVASVMLGSVLLDEGETDEAIARLFSPVLTSVRLSCLTMARHYMREGRPLAAILHLHVATQEGGYQMSIREDWRLGAELFRRQGALDLAEQTFGQMLMIDPCDTTALRGLAEVLAAKGYLRAALVCLEGARDIDPGDPRTRDALDALRRRFDDPEHHDVPIELEAPDPDWLRYAMNAEQERPVFDDVFRLADEMPGDPIVQLMTAVFLGKSARDMEVRTTREIAEKNRLLEDALRRIDRVQARLSSYTYAWARKCWLLAAAGHPDLAGSTLHRAQERRLGDALTWHRLGLTLLGEGHVELAIEAFRTATIASPGFWESHNNIGLLLVRRQTRPETPDERERRYREAAKHFEKALSLPESRRSGAHNGLGFALLNLGRVDEAVPHFKRAIALDATRATAYYFLAQAHESQHDYFECVGTLSMGLKVIPKSPLLRTYLAMMLSSAPEPGVLDGRRAVTLAESVVGEQEHPTARMFDLLAAAYAQDGQFDKAVATADQAIRAAQAEGDEAFARTVRERQRLYRAGIPFRLPPGAGPQ